MPITIRQDLIRVSLNLSISEETIASITEIELVIAAKNTRTKNKIRWLRRQAFRWIPWKCDEHKSRPLCAKTFFTAEYINRRNYHKTCEKCNGCVENLNLLTDFVRFTSSLCMNRRLQYNSHCNAHWEEQLTECRRKCPNWQFAEIGNEVVRNTSIAFGSGVCRLKFRLSEQAEQASKNLLSRSMPCLLRA